MATEDFSAGAIVKFQAEDGDYQIIQVAPGDVIPMAAKVVPTEGIADFTRSISWGEGPIIIKGTVNTSTLSISVNLSVLGFSLGNVSGDLKRGVGIHVSLVAANGDVTFYLKGGDFWVKWSLHVPFSTKSGDFRVLDL